MTDNEKLARWQGKPVHATTFREYELEIEGTIGRFVHKQCTCGRETRLGKKYNDEDTRPLCNGIDYLNDDSAAMSLLDTLVEKGYDCYVMTLQLYPTIWACRVFNSTVWIERTNKTRREAVVRACLELIERGGQS